MSPLVRRLRANLLRLVRHRTRAMGVGTALMVCSVGLPYSGLSDGWWVEGVALITFATGAALFWTGLTGASPDWVE